jgi:5-methylcytosine-specific restriction protein A
MMRCCLQPGCPVLVRSGRCPTHTRQADQGTRGTAQRRGYTYRWSMYSQAWLSHHPVCGEQQDGAISSIHGSQCAAEGRTTPAECTDHIVPVSAGGEFWSAENHQSLCLSCNTRKANTLER